MADKYDKFTQVIVAADKEEDKIYGKHRNDELPEELPITEALKMSLKTPDYQIVIPALKEEDGIVNESKRSRSFP